MKTILYSVLEAIIGLSSGIVIGGAFIALLTFLGIIPRLLQWMEDSHYQKYMTTPLFIGTFSGTLITFSDLHVSLPVVYLAIWGILQGVFNGMFAAALVEVLNVFPILARRIGLEKHILPLMMAVVFGKIFGSLFQWLYF